jgi:hypothetical protein
VAGIGHLYCHRQACFQLHTLHPWKADATDAFETSRACAWFPDACPENVGTDGLQFVGCAHHLFLGLCTARARDQQRSPMGSQGPCIIFVHHLLHLHRLYYTTAHHFQLANLRLL